MLLTVVCECKLKSCCCHCCRAELFVAVNTKFALTRKQIEYRVERKKVLLLHWTTTHRATEKRERLPAAATAFYLAAAQLLYKHTPVQQQAGSSSGELRKCVGKGSKVLSFM